MKNKIKISKWKIKNLSDIAKILKINSISVKSMDWAIQKNEFPIYNEPHMDMGQDYYIPELEVYLTFYNDGEIKWDRIPLREYIQMEHIWGFVDWYKAVFKSRF